MIYLATQILFAFAFAKRNSYQFIENRNRGKNNDLANEANTKWHAWQAVIQVLMFAVLSRMYYLEHAELYTSITVGLIGAGVFWIVFDGLVNILGLNRAFFYVGETAEIDKFFQRFDNPELMMAIAKSSFLLIGVVFFYFFTNKKKV